MEKQLLCAVMLLLLASCVRHEEIPAQAANILRASAECADGSRTGINFSSQGKGTVYWTPNESISVFWNELKNTNIRYESTNAEDATEVEFVSTSLIGIPEGSGFTKWALYPYDPSATCDGETVTTRIYGSRYGVAGTFDNCAFPMVAKSTTNELLFMNVCGGVKFTLSRDDIKKITFRGNNGEDLAGEVKISLDADNNPVTEVLSGITDIELYPAGSLTFEKGKYYYMIMLPAVLTKGFTMTFETDVESGVLEYTEKPVEIKRSTFSKKDELDPYADFELNLTVISDSLISTNTYSDVHQDFGYAAIRIGLDHMTGDWVSGSWYAGGNQYYDRWQAYGWASRGTQNGYVANIYWNEYYKWIDLCNSLISAAGTDKVARGIGKAFRAMLYLDMSGIFEALPVFIEDVPNGPEYAGKVLEVAGLTVPIVTDQTLPEERKNNPRATRHDMFELILGDLLDAADCLEEYTPASRNLPSKAVVYGILARTYLWLGGYEEALGTGTYVEMNGEEKQFEIPVGNAAYAKASEYASMALAAANCPYLTKEQYTSPTTGNNSVNSNPSWMLAGIQSVDTILTKLHTFAAHACPEAEWGYGAVAMPAVRRSTYERMADDDFRKSVISAPGAKYEDYRNVTSLTKEEWSTWCNGLGVTPYTNFKFRCNNGEKYEDTSGNIVDIPFMRSEEMFFIKAEADEHISAGSGVAQLVSFMRNYRGATSYTGGTGSVNGVEEIIFQKRCEFWGEGICFYDMKRLNLPYLSGYDGSNTPSGIRYDSKGRMAVWNVVIPSDVIQQNPVLNDQQSPDPSNLMNSREDNITMY